MPASEFPVISDVPDNIIPDVKNVDGAAGAIYRLYRGGVLTGNDSIGTFDPEGYISRSAVAGNFRKGKANFHREFTARFDLTLFGYKSAYELEAA